MKAHPRIRRMVKWGGFICASVFAMLFFVSGGECGWRDGSGLFVGLSGRNIAVYRLNPTYYTPVPGSNQSGIFFVDDDTPFLAFRGLLFGTVRHWPGNWYFGVSLLFLTMLGTLCGTIAWRRERTRFRRSPHFCAACGYDRRGLPSPDAPCPECGAAP